MYNGAKVLDVHSHIRWQPRAKEIVNQLITANCPIPSPIGRGKSVHVDDFLAGGSPPGSNLPAPYRGVRSSAGLIPEGSGNWKALTWDA
jgi:hypothetical protein